MLLMVFFFTFSVKKKSVKKLKNHLPNFFHSSMLFVDSDSAFVSIKNAFGCKQESTQELVKRFGGTVEICCNISVIAGLTLSGL